MSNIYENIIDMPFSSSVTYDKCGNSWSKKGNFTIVKDSSKGYCCQCPGTNAYLLLRRKVNIGNKNFKLSFDCCLSGWLNSGKTGSAIIISFCRDIQSENSGILQFNFHSDQLGAHFPPYKLNWPSYSPVINKWYTIVLEKVNNHEYLYVNGSCLFNQVNSTNISDDFDFNYFIIGNTYGIVNDQNGNIGFYGKISNLKFIVEEEDIIENNKFDIKRNIYHLYNIPYDSLYNYNINDSLSYNDIYRSILKDYMYDNDTYRDINKINSYNNTVYRSILRNYIYNDIIYRSILKDYMYDNDTYRNINKISEYNNDIYRSILRNYIYNNDTYRYIKRIDKYKNITKRNINKNKQVLHNTKRLIHNNINIINYIYRKKVFSNNINNDTVRSVISWKHKIMVFVTNPRYKLK